MMLMTFSFICFQERQQQKRNGPQVPIRIQSEDSICEKAKPEIKKIINELPLKKKAPPPPPIVSNLPSFLFNF